MNYLLGFLFKVNSLISFETQLIVTTLAMHHKWITCHDCKYSFSFTEATPALVL